MAAAGVALSIGPLAIEIEKEKEEKGGGATVCGVVDVTRRNARVKLSLAKLQLT